MQAPVRTHLEFDTPLALRHHRLLAHFIVSTFAFCNNVDGDDDDNVPLCTFVGI